MTSKSASIDQEVIKLRPRVVKQDREKLYDDVMKQRIATNFLQDENTKLRTRIYILENELTKKEKTIDELFQQDQNGKQISGRHTSKIDSSSLVTNLKRKVRDQQVELI